MKTGAALAVGLGVYAGEVERHILSTVHRTVEIQNLPAPFHGFRIAQLSDFHFHNYDESFFVRHAVNKLNELNPDMVALTGDFITATHDHRSAETLRQNAFDCAEILGGIHCPVRFSSMGNHDAVTPELVSDALAKFKHNLLRNSYTSVDLRGERLWISGLADAYYDVPILPRAIPQRREHEPILVLGHEPDFADTLVEYTQDVDLMLAGHTHGGQVRIPFLSPILLPAMGMKYVEGLIQLPSSRTQIYVNRGLGCMHLPFRFNCPPELTLLTLQPA